MDRQSSSLKLSLLKNFSILYIDDDIIARQSLKKILSYYFEAVYTASNGLEALEIYNINRCDLLLVDYDMPIMDGCKFLQTIREEDKVTPAVIVSSYDDKVKLKNAIKLNLVDYLVKPYTLDDLEYVLSLCLRWMDENNLIQVVLSKDIFYNKNKRNISKDDQEVSLTSYEAQVLEILIINKNTILSYDDILNRLPIETTQNSLFTIVYKLKKKIGVNIIENIKDIGYILKI